MRSAVRRKNRCSDGRSVDGYGLCMRMAWFLFACALPACGGRTEVTADAGDDASADAAADASCAAGLVACGASCVDLQTDDGNCGACGLVCSTTCTAGRCIETIAMGLHAVSLATDGSYVYWSDVASAPYCDLKTRASAAVS